MLMTENQIIYFEVMKHCKNIQVSRLNCLFSSSFETKNKRRGPYLFFIISFFGINAFFVKSLHELRFSIEYTPKT